MRVEGCGRSREGGGNPQRCKSYLFTACLSIATRATLLPMSTPTLSLRHITDLTHAELVKLAPFVKTSSGVLRAYQSEKRKMSASMAIRVEKAAKKLGWFLPREAHALGCANCEFARACRKAQQGGK